ncbi:MAG: SirB2 family protein [Zoogloea sp.]|nr:SirB2 family protein [Zoogloea sp.]
MYQILKTIHVSCVVLTGLGFAFRGMWMLSGSPLLQARLTRILPHVVDSLLLASAIGLTLVLGQYPLADAWLTAKLLGLLAYIWLGSLALRRGRSRASRTLALGLALAMYGYIVSVALTHRAAGVFALLAT